MRSPVRPGCFLPRAPLGSKHPIHDEPGDCNEGRLKGQGFNPAMNTALLSQIGPLDQIAVSELIDVPL